MQEVRRDWGDARARARARGSTAGSRALVLAVAIAAALLSAALGARPAGAIVVHLSAGRALSYEAAPGSRPPSPFDELFSNVDYSGGPVMTSNTNYAFYWDPAGAPAFPSDYVGGIDRYVEDLAHDSGGHENVDSIATQYNDDGSGAAYDSHFAGAILDTDPYPANGCTQAVICLSDEQIRAELAAYVKAHGLPADLAHEYLVLTPPGVESCFEGGCSGGTPHPAFCAYHSNFALGAGAGQVIYANLPFVAGSVCDDGNHPNGSSADATIASLSHEHLESITDPEPNNGWTDWATGETTGYEIADKCRVFEEAKEFGTPLGIAPDGARYNQLINGHEYWTQQAWSNQGHGCMQRFTLAGAQPQASFTSEALAGTQVALDASASSAPGGVAAYEWQFNDGSGGELPVESTAPTITHVFPRQGSWNVALTVFAPDGTSDGYAHAVFSGQLTQPAVSTIAPAKGPAAGGTTVRITGTNFVQVGAVHFGALSAASFTVVSPTRITAVSPAGTAATLDVTVTTPKGASSVTASDRFKLGPPTVTKLKPTAGPLAGGTLVSITGTGFAPGTSATRLKFGAVWGSEADCTSITACTVRSPKGASAVAVDVIAKVGTSTGKAQAPGDLFSYR